MTRSLAMYEDVKKILDAAIATGGGTVTLASTGQAVRWRQRAYEFRKLARASTDWSIYDRITLRKVEPGSCDVVIAVIEQPAIFKPLEGGQPVIAPTAKNKPKPADDLLDIASEIAKNIL